MSRIQLRKPAIFPYPDSVTLLASFIIHGKIGELIHIFAGMLSIKRLEDIQGTYFMLDGFGCIPGVIAILCQVK